MSKKLTTQQFVERASKIHNNKYDYSLVEYKNTRTKVYIICPIHGKFLQTPNDHLRSRGCSKCKGVTCLEDFVKKANKIHNNKYDYSKVKYINNKTKICIICPEHGEFWQRPDMHLGQKQGCSVCANKNKGKYKTNNFDFFIKKANKIHSNKYKYYKKEYNGFNHKMKIVCPVHGEFLQKPSKHVNRKQGCPICNQSHGEREIRDFLKKMNVKFIQQHKFKNCKNINVLSFDFYLPEQNLLIEFDGEQHFVSKKYLGGEEGFAKIQINDKIKNEYARKNSINLLRIPYLQKNEIEKTITEKIK